ncbi:VOC family protein [Agrobacterium rubi]|nr:VOC family protein [Agrobacterium rubi]NTF24082.1 VOC family protein [Agrobacterium rubi]
MWTITKRDILKLAGVTTAVAALPAALRAEGGQSSAHDGVLPFALTTPMHVDQVSIRVIDLPMMTEYYVRLLALDIMETESDRSVLGAGGVPLLTLRRAEGIVREDPSSAGLYHVAYLMPSREDLARWLVHAAMIRVPLDGFADHSVSEAIYLTDPEGNGIEVYSDRPRNSWVWNDGVVTMGTKALDLDGIVALADVTRDTYETVPGNLRIGHIHLRVGDVARAEEFYGGVIGLQPTRKGREDAAFYSSGGYHHHVAMNAWQSRGAGTRTEAATGLEWFSMKTDAGNLASLRSKVPSGLTEISAGVSLFDPWGTEIRLVQV